VEITLVVAHTESLGWWEPGWTQIIKWTTEGIVNS